MRGDRAVVVMLSIAVIACLLVTTARCKEDGPTPQSEVVKISVDLTVPVCLPTPAVQCPVCNCPAPPVKAATPTGPGYELIPGLGHYKFHPYGATWHQARQHCVQEGAHLIVINSQREADVVTALFARNPTMPGAEQTDWAWTGVHEQGGNGNYVTLTGEPLSATGFAFWSPTEPNDGGPNDCVLTHRINSLLADADCGRVFAFICELEL